MHKILSKLSLVLSVGLAISLFPWGTNTELRANQQDETVLVLAGVSDEPAKVLRRYQPLADYLVGHLGDEGILAGEVRVAPDIATLSDWLEAGEVDLFFDSLYPAMTAIDRSGAEPILRRWKNGVASYNAIIFARADRGVNSLSDLQGQLIALEDPLSTSGYMLPLAHLRQQGFNPILTDGGELEIASDEIGYVFSGEDQNTIQWVISGQVTAGVTDSGSYSELPEATRDGLIVLAETEELPRQVVVARASMDEELESELISVLLAMDEDEAGRTVLEAFKNTSQFDEFPEGAEAAIERMRQLYELAIRQ